MKKLVLFLSLLISFSSCEKETGEGGTSVIQGQVYKIHTFQNFTTGEWDTLYYQLDSGKDVYIIYSDDINAVYDDKFETDYNGVYRFDYLRKGDYIIYTYADSIDMNNVSYDFPLFTHITISNNNSVNTVEDFVIEKNQ
jgi:hypothetical protein